MTQNLTLNFESTDRLGLKPFCERMENFLLVEHDYVDGSLVLGLNAGFGAGKTTFLKMWESDLRSRREQGKFVPMPLVLNAWESDYCGDPLLAILANLIEALDEWNGDENQAEKSALKEAAKDMAWFALGLGNGVAAKFTGIDAVKAGDFAEGKKKSRKPVRPDIIEIYHQRSESLKILKMKLAAAFGGEMPKILVFVDELDRCRPDYAVSYLETIKHVFDVRGMVFVLAIDYGHLANSAKALFGQDLVFEEYFRKFCHRVFQLPEPTENAQMTLAREYIGKYLVIEGKRSSLLKINEGVDRKIVELTMALKLRPRQVQEAFRILGHSMYTVDPSREGKLYWGIGAGTILLSFVRVALPTIFVQLQKGEGGPTSLCRKLVELMGMKTAEWWIQLILTGSLDYDNANDFVLDILRELKYVENDRNDYQQYLSGFDQAWGERSNRIRQIANMIEDAKSF